MRRHIGPVSLVASTAIGVGMLALPLMLAKLGVILSVLLMFGTWLLIYYSVLMNVELNLQIGQALSIGDLSARFAGPMAKFIGVVSLKLLSYVLLAVYIYGATSIIVELLVDVAGVKYSFDSIASLYVSIVAAILAISIRLVDYVNRLLFVGLLSSIALLLAVLIFKIDWSHLPLYEHTSSDIAVWRMSIPLVFTAFGFQPIIHTVVDYCKGDSALLKRVFFYGTIIPALVYGIWVCTVLTAICQYDSTFYQRMIEGRVEVGDMISALSQTYGGEIMRIMWWVISILAIITSMIGVGIGMIDAINHKLHKYVKSYQVCRLLSLVVTVLPPYFVALVTPNAFIVLLRFAGVISVVIGVLLPVYLVYRARIKNFVYQELQYQLVWLIVGVCGWGIVVCEVINLLGV
ncbi:amino acid permease [Rickettsiales endosymbiont of Peranema trichophorum]|uniref:amino acid permease n=1 Tax=Rickettsiales endosymbiont of Peranema trichophorum TaxID=2486577 RepID=UPI00102346B1|nr:aromatic amino acid transport family protein [Rickettsiales endosymbiont of Peranema trichophorum]RZI47280.1 amino acid permease [Rickettsiales endosymbiont of Peranema trichophorum]